MLAHQKAHKSWQLANIGSLKTLTPRFQKLELIMFSGGRAVTLYAVLCHIAQLRFPLLETNIAECKKTLQTKVKR